MRIGAILSGSAGLAKTGEGTLILAGANTFSGRTTVQQGTLRLEGAGALAGALTVAAQSANAVARFDYGEMGTSVTQLTLGGSTTTSAATVSGLGVLTLAGGLSFDASGDALGATLSGRLSLGSASRTFDIGNSTSTTEELLIDAVVSGATAAGITKAGIGNLVLTGLNTYTGQTRVNGGTLTFETIGDVGSGASSLGSPQTVAHGTIRLGNGATQATLRYRGTGHSTDRQVDLANTANGSTIEANGSGALVFNSAFTATGAGDQTLTLAGSSTAGNAIWGAIPDNSTLNQTILKKDGTGRWELYGNNSFSGGVTVSRGTLRAGGSAQALGTGMVTLNGTPTLELAGDSDLDFGNQVSVTTDLATIVIDRQTEGGSVSHGLGTLQIGLDTLSVRAGTNLTSGEATLTFDAVSLTDAAANPTFDVGAATRLILGSVGSGNRSVRITGAGNATMAGALNLGSGVNGVALRMSGSGELALSAANNFSGRLVLEAGTTRFANPAALGTGIVELAGGALTIAADSGITLANSIQLTGQSTIWIDRSTPGELAGQHEINSISLGPHALTFRLGSNISSGSAVVGIGQVSFIGSQLPSYLLADPNIGLVVHNSVSGLNRSLVIGGAGHSEFNGSLDIGTGSLTKTGTGIATLTASTSSFSGRTHIQEGILQVSTLANYGQNSSLGAPNGGSISLGSADLSATLRYTGSGDSTNRELDLAGSSGAVTIESSGSGSLTLGGRIFASNGGDKTLILGGDNQMSNTVTGPIQDYGSGENGTLGLRKSGTGTWHLAGSNGFTGAIHVEAGRLNLVDGATFSSKVALLLSGGILRFDHGSQAFASLSGTAGKIEFRPGYVLTLNEIATGSYSGLFEGDGELVLNGGGTLTLSGTDTVNSWGGSATVRRGTLQLGADHVLPDNSAVTIAGTTERAELHLNGFTDVVGGVSFGDGSNVSPGIESVLATGTGLLRLRGPVSYNMSGSAPGTARLTGQVDLGNESRTFSIGNSGANIELLVSASLSGSGGVNKTGSGTLAFDGNNTFTGQTIVSAGKLVVNGSLASSGVVTVLADGTLGGNGHLGQLEVYGNLSPGNSPGTLHANDTTWYSGGSYDWEINSASGSAGTHWDLLAVTGTLSIQATSATPFTVNLFSLNPDNTAGTVIDFNPAQNYRFSIATATNGILGFSGDNVMLNLLGFNNAFSGTWNIDLNGSSLDVVYVAIPEPSHCIALLGTLVLMGCAVRRWRCRFGE